MSEKLITASEMGRRGSASRAGRHGKAQIRAWGKLGGRPQKLGKVALARVDRMPPEGVPKAQIATRLDIWTRTVTRYVCRMNEQG